MTTYCAPCVADLALLREAVTSVNGTASCIAHAVLLTHPTDTPQRRLTRLGDLRSTAEEKLATAPQDDVPSIELLIQEYTLAGAMDMTVPLKDLAGDRQPRPPKNRRGRGRDGRPDGRGEPRGPREERADAAPAEAPAAEAPGAPAAEAPAPTPAPEPVPTPPAPAPEPVSTPPAPEVGDTTS